MDVWCCSREGEGSWEEEQTSTGEQDTKMKEEDTKMKEQAVEKTNIKERSL